MRTATPEPAGVVRGSDQGVTGQGVTGVVLRGAGVASKLELDRAV